MKLPDDVASALTDGVVLCHLANQVQPRSVVSIHVPSPDVVSCIRIFNAFGLHGFNFYPTSPNWPFRSAAVTWRIF